MILDPVAVDETAGGTTVVSAANARRGKAIVIQNPTGSSTCALAFDGGEVDLTFANGLILEGGMERVIEEPKGGFHNAIVGICDTGESTTLRVHVIE